MVAFFSPDDDARHPTRTVAKLIAEITDGDTYEIKPKIPYTAKDLVWQNKNSRSTKESNDPNSRPELADTDAKIEDYDVIYLGFPIWWYLAPHIIYTFLETYDFRDKKVITFATSEGSGFGDTVKHLRLSSPDAQFIEGRVFRGRVDLETIANWLDSLSL